MKVNWGKVKQVKSKMFTTESWLKVKKKKDTFCSKCKKNYIDLNESHVGFAIIEGTTNKHICQNCAADLKALGGKDMDKALEQHKFKKESIIERLNELEYKIWRGELSDLKIEELEKHLEVAEEKESKRLAIEKDILNYVETETEDYLIDQYKVVENKEWLKTPLQIEDYFLDCGTEYFECGQGFAQDEAYLIVKIGSKFYNVRIKAQIESSKQDFGDRLYWVEGFESISHSEIPKPQPKPVQSFIFNVNAIDEKLQRLKTFLTENNYTFKINQNE